MSRLHLVRRLALLGGGAFACVGGLAYAEPAGGAPVAVGILGTGWGLKVQLPQLRAAGMQVVALHSRDAERRAAVAREHELPYSFTSVEKLCASDTVELVSCVGPTHTRKGQAIAALANGKHVLIEKPMGLDEGEACEIMAASRAVPDARAWMDFELRCLPAVVRMRDLIQSGELGPPQHIAFRCLGNFRWLSGSSSHWALRECGGGVFSAVGTHFVDLTRHLTGREVRRVSASQRSLVPSLPDANGVEVPVTADGLCAATMELCGPDAPLVTMLISGKSPGLPFENALTISCARGVLKLDLLTSTLTIFREGADGTEEVGGGGNAWSDVGTPALGRAISSALRGAAPTASAEPGGVAVGDLATLVDGVLVQRVTDAVHKSAAGEGAWLEVDSTPP